MAYCKSAIIPCCCGVCGAAEKGWIQPVSHKPSSSLRLLSGPGSPKKRAFTLHCACYSSQHSTHGHVSVFIALNINFHSHHVLCLHRTSFSFSKTISFMLQCSSSSASSFSIYAPNVPHCTFLSRNATKNTLLFTHIVFQNVSFKLYLSNPVAWVGLCRKMLPASLQGSWEYLQKKQQECHRVKALRPGYYIIN